MPDNHTWEGKSRGNQLGYKIFVGLLKYGGLRPAYGLLHFVTMYYRMFVPSATAPLKTFYKKLGYNSEETGKLVKRNLLIFGQTLIDKIVILTGIKNNFVFTHDGIHHVEELVKNGKGGVLVSAHLGNWEVAGQLLEMIDTTINIVMYDGEEQQIKSYIQQFENNRSFNLILIKDDLSHIYEMSAALNRNELICLHADRFRPGNRTMEHEFLGEIAKFPAGPFILASKLKAPVCFVFAFKETNFHYHFYAFPGKVYEGRGTEGMNTMLNDYTALLEKMVKKYPTQWFNYFEFWKQ